MNLLTILDKLSDDKFFSTETSRLGSLSQFSAFGKKAALAAIPLGLGSFMATSAKAETTQEMGFAAASALTGALQLALTLEYLEDEYYRTGINTAGLIPAGDKVVFQQISKHETAHVAFLKSALTSLGEAPGMKPNFDFTAGGNFQPFTDYQTFLTLAQAFEDTGVRAYKGQAGNVASNKDVLQAALQIHSVEARHASKVRRMRMNKGWIELNVGGNMPAATNAVYAGEENITQAGYNTSTLFGAPAGSASFDEILTGDQAAAIAGIFIS
ncbi:ferritin-like domain-containing protein [Kaistella sp. G5-32]|uniref:Ferritin-like domain-containing protein n=1 Tax=Kaistella gelatinilytica TaxID=2787636 RepID=A0ABS0FEB8_9FLAO|nr:ferritin-like domain-containing protein [Kaistella gelatinilytica]MBF8458067.1 ferritin-like domain-containing protein [Kaistella gelatinilytica]